MTENMTVCPECGTVFETTETRESLPTQWLDQSCPDCGYSVAIAVINYPDGTHEVVAPALQSDVCADCDERAIQRAHRVGGRVRGRCVEHVRADHTWAMREA